MICYNCGARCGEHRYLCTICEKNPDAYGGTDFYHHPAPPVAVEAGKEELHTAYEWNEILQTHILDYDGFRDGDGESSSAAPAGKAMTFPAYLDQVEARATAATEAPWVVHDFAVWDANGVSIISDYDGKTSAFIAASRQDIPALVAMLREATEALEYCAPFSDKCNAALAKLAGLVPEG